MALHDFACAYCGYSERDVFLSLAETSADRPCAACGAPMEQTFRPSVWHAFIPYLDENIAERPVWITSERQRQKLMDQSGLEYRKKWTPRGKFLMDLSRKGNQR